MPVSDTFGLFCESACTSNINWNIPLDKSISSFIISKGVFISTTGMLTFLSLSIWP
uniref:Uncharacterized protein n=1 Tax=Anguilla anguilla TaxID=7936 RepID=A0A0E9SK62_ANGAN